MIKNQEAMFIKNSVKSINAVLVKRGIIILNEKELDKAVLEIGKEYHRLEKEDEI